MRSKSIKYIFLFCSASLLVIMLLASRTAGINADEVLHYNHSVSVYNYYATQGADKSALDTPVTHLKYYGQSFDNLVTILIKWFDLDDVYRFRHFMSSLMGWLVIVMTALFAIWLKNYLAGIIVLFLFALSPTFMGHAQNNLKDVPFAFAYIASVFYMLKSLFYGRKTPLSFYIMTALYIAFAISIRAGGILLVCYLFFFFTVFYFLKYLEDRKVNLPEISRKFIILAIISVVAMFLSLVLWPYGLQNPITGILKSYRVMAHFPDTFRQIFEGKVEWSDHMPWYYLIKSMGITIPMIVLTGLLLFMIFSKNIFSKSKSLIYIFIIFSVFFPVVFVVIEKSNLYSSWRQFLFVYPGIVLLASIGISTLRDSIKNRYLLLMAGLVGVWVSIHPLKFIINNHPYEYLYYNQMVGGLKGAYGNYETDYYYVSQTEASEWLIDYLKIKGDTSGVKVKATYSVKWLFRNYPGIETSYFRYEERSMTDWDYAIIANRYIPPEHLKNNIWPPKNAIHIIYADQVPVGAVLQRKTKSDYLGYRALMEGRSKDAITLFEEVLKSDDKDEMIFYNFAGALYRDGQFERADSALKRGLDLNPASDPILMYMGNIAKAGKKYEKAIMYYEKLISSNRKYFEAYVELSGLLVGTDIIRARQILRTCLTLNPKFKPAVVALADTYRKSDPEIAKKYDEWARSLNN
jgi:tetratricopeptide (TPR) repeat protein